MNWSNINIFSIHHFEKMLSGGLRMDVFAERGVGFEGPVLSGVYLQILESLKRLWVGLCQVD